MNFKVNKESVKSFEKICQAVQEQPVELDYVLPDYYPEIFRIMGCEAEPRVTLCGISGDRVTYELTVCIRVIYCPESGGQPEAVEQKLSYSRTVNLDKQAVNAAVYIKASPDHINCRAVNRRRIDVRGAVTVTVEVMGETDVQVICDAFGGSVELKKSACLCPSSIIHGARRVTISDELEIGDNPPVGSIIKCGARVISTDKKLVAGKLAAKGELKISLVYTPSGDNSDRPVCALQFTLPYSQLIDMEGLDSDYDCSVYTEVVSCEIIPRSSGDGEATSLECEVMLFIDCTAVKSTLCEIACDEYSTAYNSSHSSVPVKIRSEPENIDSIIIVKGTCENKDSPLAEIYDVSCRTDKLRTEREGDKIKVTGTVRLTVIGRAENGDFILCESDVPVEEVISADPNTAFSENAVIRLTFNVLSCTYTIGSENTAEIKAEIAVRGRIEDYRTVNAVTEITLDEQAPRERQEEFALKLYFADPGEELWDIAKGCGASVGLVMEENELDSGTLSEGRMLLIPMV
ncbi:MAG: DUF3794 domain-containing protein [Oscillospiraceae bacterium]|nr:DUF3794 domain-containing protein [Oscillospiraceae bacterium]